MGLLQDSYIAYVNLDHRQDRNIKMIESLEKAGIKEYSRIRGMLPTEWPEKAQQMTAMLRRPQVGAIGCYLSQEKIIKKALELNKHAFVCEDDIIFCSDFMKRVDYVNDWILRGERLEDEKEWDIVWWGATFHVGGRGPYWHTKTIGRDAQLTSDPRIIQTFGSFCTYCYTINRTSIEKVLSLLDQFLPQSIGIDHSMINISPQLKTYAFVPGCVIQYDNLSDQIPSKQHITEFSGFSRLNGSEENSKYWYQDRMENFDPTIFDWQEAQTKRWDWQK